MLMELHAHTAEHSGCSMIPVRDLIGEAIQRGLEGVVLTDHHHLWDPAELELIRRALSLPPSFTLLSGQEVTTIDHGDILVYGATRRLPFGITLDELRRETPDAALVWAHPFRWGAIPVASAFHDPSLDAVEIINGNQTEEENMRGVNAWKRFRMHAVSGSDCHIRGRVGLFPTSFPRPVRSLEELVRAIRAGDCHPTGCISDGP